jgi:hypothetical protein
MTLSRTAIARRGVAKAAEIRERFDIAPQSAVNIFDLCGERLEPKITIRFKDISMEGVYLRAKRAEIWLGLRPPTRRVFNCAHELGHHVFGHGSTLDELQSEEAANQPFHPDEYLVNTFAAYLLMPRLAVAWAFSARGWRVANATPEQCFIVACSLGVGYETLANHLVYSLQLVAGSISQRLLGTRLPSIRRGLLKSHAPDRLTVVDQHYTLSTLDTEVGTTLLLPAGAMAESTVLAQAPDAAEGRIFQAVRPGIARVHTLDSSWAVLVRVMRDQYVGLGRYRHFDSEAGDND